MKTRIVFFVIFCALTLSGMAQTAGQRTVIRTDDKGVVKSVEYAKEDESVRVPKSADEFFQQCIEHSNGRPV